MAKDEVKEDLLDLVLEVATDEVKEDSLDKAMMVEEKED